MTLCVLQSWTFLNYPERTSRYLPPNPVVPVASTEIPSATDIPGGSRALLLHFGPVLQHCQKAHLHLHFFSVAHQDPPIQVIPQHLRDSTAKRPLLKLPEGTGKWAVPHPALLIMQNKGSLSSGRAWGAAQCVEQQCSRLRPQAQSLPGIHSFGVQSLPGTAHKAYQPEPSCFFSPLGTFLLAGTPLLSLLGRVLLLLTCP